MVQLQNDLLDINMLDNLKNKRVVIPFIILFLIIHSLSYGYFSTYDHINIDHEWSGVTYKDILRHYKEGCENFGTENRE